MMDWVGNRTQGLTSTYPVQLHLEERWTQSGIELRTQRLDGESKSGPKDLTKMIDWVGIRTQGQKDLTGIQTQGPRLDGDSNPGPNQCCDIPSYSLNSFLSIRAH